MRLRILTKSAKYKTQASESFLGLKMSTSVMIEGSVISVPTFERKKSDIKFKLHDRFFYK